VTYCICEGKLNVMRQPYSNVNTQKGGYTEKYTNANIKILIEVHPVVHFIIMVCLANMVTFQQLLQSMPSQHCISGSGN